MPFDLPGPAHVRRRSLNPNRTTSGFTLLELLVVVAIIGLLAAYVGPRYFSQIGRSEQAVAKSQIEGFGRALNTYRIDMGSFPAAEDGLGALVSRPADATRAIHWRGPYLEKAVPKDPWGNAYVYRTMPGETEDFEVLSHGKDGRAGGEGDAADISNR